MAQQQKEKVKGCTKCYREINKRKRKGSPISNFVRGKITGEQYFKQTGQKIRG